jgi:tetratricopeptide (TPR) repeat protein
MKTIHRLATGIAAFSLLSLASAVVAQDAAAPVDPAAAKAAAKARAKQVAAWKAQYGPGPYPDEVETFAQGRQEELRGYYRVLYYDGEHNAVLNYERLGLLSMELGYYGDAEKAFDGALDRIEAFYNKDKQAEKATSATRLEVNKDFKGEPYERAMAYYYRGLLYLRKGDYDNARASFKAAEYQDTVSGEESFQSDFALLTYLQGWASQCAGDGSQAADAFEQAAKIDPKLKVPGPNDNVLVLTELGIGPVKATDGQYQEKLVFRPGAAMPENGAIVTLGAGKTTRAWPLTPAADIYTQASTRGGRAIDGILDGKAQFKAGLETTSALATTVGSSFAQQMGGNALYAQGIGAALSMFSKSVRPTADTRMWDGLPSSIMAGTTRWGAAAPAAAAGKGKKPAPKVSLSAGEWSMPSVSMTYRQDDNALDLTGTKPMAASAGKCGIVWARSRSVASLPSEAPGNNAKIALARKRDKDVWAKDEAFSAKLR